MTVAVPAPCGDVSAERLCCSPSFHDNVVQLAEQQFAFDWPSLSIRVAFLLSKQIKSRFSLILLRYTHARCVLHPRLLRVTPLALHPRCVLHPWHYTHAACYTPWHYTHAACNTPGITPTAGCYTPWHYTHARVLHSGITPAGTPVLHLPRAGRCYTQAVLHLFCGCNRGCRATPAITPVVVGYT